MYQIVLIDGYLFDKWKVDNYNLWYYAGDEVTLPAGIRNSTVFRPEWKLDPDRMVALYGKYVNGYISKGEGLSNLTWQLYYEDENWVYLISSLNGEPTFL